MKTIHFYRLFLMLICLSVGVYASAQTGTITGKVIDDTGEPAIGATVQVDGTTNGTSADFDGNYTLKGITAGQVTITASFIGYSPQSKTITLTAGGNLTVDFTIGENAEILNEVVVVGYGTMRKREVVGSITKLEGSSVDDVVGGSFENALQGKAAGVQITQSSGVAGSGSIVRIRGIGSLSAGGDPLYVVDGIPITQDNFISGNRGNINNNPLSSINPDDIESIEILKDASAAAIYGSRGGNGVILITTKRGKNEKSKKPQFNFNSNFGVSNPTKRPNMMNSSELLQVMQEAWENDGNVGKAPLPLNRTYEEIEGVDTDWVDEVVQTGFKQDYGLSMKTGGEKISSYVGLSYTDAESYLIGNSYERLTGRANLDIRPTKQFDISLSSSLAKGTNNRIPQEFGGGLGLAMSSALPFYPIYNDDGSYFNQYGNPVAQRELQDWKTQEWRTINNFRIGYRPMKGLSINVVGNYDYMKLTDYFHEDELWTTVGDIAKGYTTFVNNWSSYGTATYDVKLPNDAHALKVMGGLEYQVKDVKGKSQEYLGLDNHINLNPNIDEMIFDTLNFAEYEINRELFASMFFRANYTFQDRYLLQVVYRRDASSKFGANKRFGDFPSVGLGYIMTEEGFLKDHKVINFLKLKASWGLTGNANIDWREQYARSYTEDNDIYNGNNIIYQSKLENPDLQWEVNSTFDMGFELGLLNDRFTTELTYYNKLTTDALISTRIQASSGLEDLDFYQNVGKIRNHGIEFNFVSRNLVGKLKWTTRFNIARNRNKVLDVGTATPDALAGGFGDTRAIPGEEVNTNYLVPFSHVDPETGRPVYIDIDGNETFLYRPVLDRRAVGSGSPNFLGGLTNTFSYEGFDLSFLFTFSQGGKIYDDAAKRHLGVVWDWNMRPELFDRWREPGDVAAFPELTYNMENYGGTGNAWQNNTTLWLYDASYIRLKTLSLAYNIPLKNTKIIRSARLTASATNLLTFTKYPGLDPEVARAKGGEQERNIGSSNVSFLTAPQERTFNFGLNVDF